MNCSWIIQMVHEQFMDILDNPWTVHEVPRTLFPCLSTHQQIGGKRNIWSTGGRCVIRCWGEGCVPVLQERHGVLHEEYPVDNSRTVWRCTCTVNSFLHLTCVLSSRIQEPWSVCPHTSLRSFEGEETPWKWLTIVWSSLQVSFRSFDNTFWRVKVPPKKKRWTTLGEGGQLKFYWVLLKFDEYLCPVVLNSRSTMYRGTHLVV
jgi:hypothetical protein